MIKLDIEEIKITAGLGSVQLCDQVRDKKTEQ